MANQPALRACLSVSGLTMGTLLGPIREVEADHICVGAAAPIALPEGMRCDYALGTVVQPAAPCGQSVAMPFRLV